MAEDADDGQPDEGFPGRVAVILLMPSDILVMMTVGIHLEQNNASYIDALPFIGLTVAVAALPLLARCCPW